MKVRYWTDKELLHELMVSGDITIPNLGDTVVIKDMEYTLLRRRWHIGANKFTAAEPTVDIYLGEG